MPHGTLHPVWQSLLMAWLFVQGATGCQVLMSDKEDPNLKAEPRCGDGVMQRPEYCDLDDLGGQSCESLGIGEGVLGCFADCTFDASGCSHASTNAKLGTLLVSQGLLTPPFDPSTHYYTVDVSNRALVVTVTALAQDPDARVRISPEQPMTLDFGDNTVTVRVMAQNGDVELYVVIVRRDSLLSMVEVPGGSFYRDSSPENMSTVSPFQMSATEVTRSQYLLVMGADPSDSDFSSGLEDPVQMVGWYHAIAFCNRLSLVDGLTPVYQVQGVDFGALVHADVPTESSSAWDGVAANWVADGYRLPTEMEWMWAAMGAASQRDKAFAGSTGTNEIGDYAVFGYGGQEDGRTEFARTDPVGSRLPNELGLSDMSGNVWEWVWDWYGDVPGGAVTDYRGPFWGSGRVTRGGSWSDSGYFCRVAYRASTPSAYQNVRYGFRVVRQRF